MDVSLQLKRWFEDSLQTLIDGIESVEKIMPFLRAKAVISDGDCEEILTERGSKQRVELCLLKVMKNDQTTLYRNVWAALSLPYPRLYADVCRRLHERFGPAVLEGLPSPQVQVSPLNPQLEVPVTYSESSNTTSSQPSSMEVLKVRLQYQQELDLVQAQLETLQTEMMTLKSVVDEERREKEALAHQCRTARREREEVIEELDQRVKERYDMQQQLQEALRDLDEVTAKNNGLNIQLQQIGVVMKDQDELFQELEKIKRQRDQSISDRKNLSERKAQVESELESTLLRYEESIKESEGKAEEQKKLTRELMKLQMQMMELQLENSKLRKDLQMMHEMEARMREHGLASPRDSGVSGDMRGWDGVKLKITLSISQGVSQEKTADVGIVLDSGIFVKELVREGIAAMDGQLVVGDRLLEVNGLGIANWHVKDILDLIGCCKSDLVLTVGRVTPRTRPIRVAPQNGPSSRSSTLLSQPYNTGYSPMINGPKKYSHLPHQEDRSNPKILTFPYRSGYNPLSHHTSDNVSLRSFAYNPHNRPMVLSQQSLQYHGHSKQLVSHANNTDIHMSASIADFQHYQRHTQQALYHKKDSHQLSTLSGFQRRRSISSPMESFQNGLEQPYQYGGTPSSPYAAGTIVDRYFQQPNHQLTPSSIDRDKKQTMSASQNALFQVDSSDSDDHETANVIKKRSVAESGTSTSTSEPLSSQTEMMSLTLQPNQIQSPSLETLTAGEPQLLASGFPMVGSSLTTTDIKLAIRGPDVLINSAKASTKEGRRTSTKMPTFLKDPKMIDVKKYGSRNCRYIELKTSAVSSDIGFSIMGGRGVGIFVSAIHENAHMEAGLRVGDQILELNGIDLLRSTYEKASATLSFVSFGGGAVMCVEYSSKKYSQLQATCRDDFHVRVLFDYHPEQGSGEMALKEGDILHVKDTMYEDNIDVWFVTKLPKGKFVGETGCVPSRSRACVLHRPLKHTPSYPPPSGVIKRRGSWKQKLSKKSKPLTPDEPKDLGTRTTVRQYKSMPPDLDGLGKRESMDEPVVPVNNAMALFEAAKNVATDENPGGYEYVEKVFYDSLRPILIIGPLASCMANRLTQEDPMKFSLALPEFFETYDEVQKGLQDNSIIYCSQRSAYGNYACITANIIKKITEQNQHCLLDIGPQSIARLKGADLKPIVIFLSPKSERKLRSCCMQLNISAIEAHSMFVDARRVWQEYQSCFSGEVSLGTSIDRCMIRVRDMVQAHQNKIEWIAVPE